MDEKILGILGFKEKEFAVFCGAGISFNSGLPLADELKRYILKQLPINDEDIEEIMNSTLPFEAFMETLDENAKISKILDLFKEGEANTNHILMAKLAKAGILKAICTTNFDLLIEKALENEGLEKGKDFEVYCNEEEFSVVDFKNLKKINIFKIHGSAEDEKSVRTTLKMVATKDLSDERMNVIRHLFSTGKHEKVLVLGYSCSDVFDITPQIESIEINWKEIILVEHSSTEGIEDIKIREDNNPFKKFPGKRIKCDTDDFIRNLWDSLKGTIEIEEYKHIISQVNWNIYIDDWSKELKGEYSKYFIASLTLHKLSNFKGEIKYHEKSLEIAKAIGNKKIEASCYRNLGIAYRNFGDFKKAIKYHEKSLEITKTQGKKGKEARCYRNLGNVYHGLGDFKRAIEHYEKGLEITKAIGGKKGEARFYRSLGNAYHGLGDFKRAIEHYEKGLEITKAIRDKKGEETCYTNLGNASRSLENPKRAIEYYEKSLELAKARGDKSREARCYGNLGNTYHDLGDFKRAIEYHEKDLGITKAIGNKKGDAACYTNIGLAYGDLGDFNKAIEYYFKAEKIFRETEQFHHLNRVYRSLYLAYAKIGDYANAEECKKKSKEIHSENIKYRK